MLGLGLGNLAGGKSQRPPECVFADEAFETSEVAAAEWHATCDTKAQELGPEVLEGQHGRAEHEAGSDANWSRC